MGQFHCLIQLPFIYHFMFFWLDAVNQIWVKLVNRIVENVTLFLNGLALMANVNYWLEMLDVVLQIWLQSDYDKLCMKIFPVMPYTHYFHGLVITI